MCEELKKLAGKEFIIPNSINSFSICIYNDGVYLSTLEGGEVFLQKVKTIDNLKVLLDILNINIDEYFLL